MRDSIAWLVIMALILGLGLMIAHPFLEALHT